MEFVSTLAWFINFAFSSVNEVRQLLLSVLNINYTVVSKVIEFFFVLWNLFSKWTYTCFSGIECVLEDFSHFLKDIFEVLFMFSQFIWTVMDVSINASVNFITSTRNLFNSIFSYAFNIAFVMQDQSTTFFEIISHILKLCVSYLVLLFQTVPHVLITGMKALTLAVFTLSLKCISSIFVAYHLVKNAVVKLDKKFRDAFFGISFDAYTGIVIAVVSFCILKTILDYVVQHGVLIPDFQLPQHLESVMNYVVNCFSRLHHWLISWLFYQNEQNDSEDEEYGTEQEDFEQEQQQEVVERPSVDLNPSKRKSLSRLRLEVEESDDENNRGTHLDVKIERERELCVVCQDHPKNVILLPCRHFCLCQTCRSAVIVLRHGCPICRQPILDTLHVFT